MPSVYVNSSSSSQGLNHRQHQRLQASPITKTGRFGSFSRSNSHRFSLSSSTSLSNIVQSTSFSKNQPLHSAFASSSTPAIDYELKNAQDALEGSISAVLNFLKHEGVSMASIDQLNKNLNLKRYYAVLKRSQDYFECITNGMDILLQLAIHAWESLCKLNTIQYKRAHKLCYLMRYEWENTSSQDLKDAVALQIQLAERCTTSQKGLYKITFWQRKVMQRQQQQQQQRRQRRRSSCAASTTSSVSSASTISSLSSSSLDQSPNKDNNSSTNCE